MAQDGDVGNMQQRLRIVLLALLCGLMLGEGCHSRGALPSDPAERAQACAALRLELPATVAAAEAARGRQPLSDEQIRALYVCVAEGISERDRVWQAEGRGVEERARLAYETRHHARLIARAMMVDQAEVRELRARDQERYGHPDGPTFDWLVEKGRAEGKSEEEIYLGIIESAQRTDAATNRRFGLTSG